MEWKFASEHKPKISIMYNSAFDLLIWDGKDYHRGFAKAVFTTEPTNKSIFDINYFSHETGNYIHAIMFLEIEPAKKGLAQNIWRTIWDKKQTNVTN